jgi:GT2 family glycosyltransferase
MPLFSVIIPTFERVGLLDRSLNSVFAQRFTDFETIVVDDGSTDGTAEYLKVLDQRINVLGQPNQGPGCARNLGARHARGDYLAFLDSDDLWFPWTLETYRDVVECYREPAFIAGKPLRFSNENGLGGIACSALRAEAFADYLASGDEWRWWSASSFVIRRDAFMEVGGFTDEWINGEDADLALRLGVAPGFIQIVTPVTFAYREHAASAKKDVNRTFAGATWKVRTEQAGRYPGGRTRASERRRILTRHTRPVTLQCLRLGLRREAWDLYVSTFAWNASLGRLKYLAAFPFVALGAEFQRPGRRLNECQHVT